MYRTTGHLGVTTSRESNDERAIDSTKVVIRRATLEDADFIARGILIATRSQLRLGFWDAVFELNEADCVKALAILASSTFESWNHCNRFLIAELDNQSVSTLCTYDPAETGVLLLLQAMEELFSLLELESGEQYLIWDRMRASASCVPQHEPGTFVIENTATMPEYRRRGFASKLVNEALANAREDGYKIAALNILIGNDEAQRVYARFGFEVTDEKTDASFEQLFGVPGVRRMECRLD